MGITQNPFARLALCWAAILFAAYLMSAVFVTYHFANKGGRAAIPSTQRSQYATKSEFNGPFTQTVDLQGTRFENCDTDVNGLPILLPQSLILWLTLSCGCLGVGRFVSGYVAFGVLQLLSAACCGIWLLVDVILILTSGFDDEQNGCPFYPNFTPQEFESGVSLLSNETLVNFLNVIG